MNTPRSVLLLLLLAWAGAAEEPWYPEEAGLVDVTRPPWSVANDGRTDVSDQLQAAITWIANRQKAPGKAGLYLPAGTYLVSKPLTVVTPHPKTGKPIRMGHVWLQGAGRERTILRLADNAPGFGGGNKDLFDEDGTPHLAVLRTNTEGAPPDAAIENFVRDLTIDVGRNRNAIGLDFLGNNIAAVERVTIRAPEGFGLIGLWLMRIQGPCLINQVRVEGFRAGIVTGHFTGLLNVVLTDIELEGQREVGFLNRSLVCVLHRLRSRNRVPAVVTTLCPQKGKDGEVTMVRKALTTVLDADLDGGDPGQPAMINESWLLARDVRSTGYGSALRERGQDLPPGRITEQVSDGPLALFPGRSTTLGLEIKPPPEPPRCADAALWANVRSFRPGGWPQAKAGPPPVALAEAGEAEAEANPQEEEEDPPEVPDATTFVQAALDSGKPVVVLPKGRYRISRTLIVPASVQRICGMGSRLDPIDGGDFDQRFAWRPLLRVAGAGEALHLEFFGMVMHGNAAVTRGGVCFIQHAGARPLVIRHCGLRGYHALPGAGPLWVDDVTGVDWRLAPGQQAWFRQIDPEHSEHIGIHERIRADGAQAVILGLKTEGANGVLTACGGGQVELFGGYLRPSSGFPLADVAFRCDAGSYLQVSYGGCTSRADRAYSNQIRETQAGTTRDLSRQQLAAKGLEVRGEGLVPLYLGGGPADWKPAPVGFPGPAQDLPGGWDWGELGTCDLAGELTVVEGGLQIAGSGQLLDRRSMRASIGGQGEAAAFARLALAGDGAIQARLCSPRGQSQELKGSLGLMLRSSDRPEAPMVFLGACLRPAEGRAAPAVRALRLLARSAPGATASVVAELPFTDPAWMRLERRGGEVVAASSADGQTWQELGRASLPNGAGLIGVAASSDFPNKLLGGVFSDLRVMGAGAEAWLRPPSLPAPWQACAIGGPLLPTVGAGHADGVFSLRGAGWFFPNNVEEWCEFVHQPVLGDQELLARVRWPQAPGPDARAGLSLRLGYDNRPPLGVWIGLGAHDVVLNGRFHPKVKPKGTVWPDCKPMAVADPSQGVWLRLARRGEHLVGYASPDGQSWQRIGGMDISRLTLPLLLGGAFASSGNLDRADPALIDHLELRPATIPDADLPRPLAGAAVPGPGASSPDSTRAKTR